MDREESSVTSVMEMDEMHSRLAKGQGQIDLKEFGEELRSKTGKEVSLFFIVQIDLGQDQNKLHICFVHPIFSSFGFWYFGHFSCVIFFPFFSVLPILPSKM